MLAVILLMSVRARKIFSECVKGSFRFPSQVQVNRAAQSAVVGEGVQSLITLSVMLHREQK